MVYLDKAISEAPVFFCKLKRANLTTCAVVLFGEPRCRNRPLNSAIRLIAADLNERGVSGGNEFIPHLVADLGL